MNQVAATTPEVRPVPVLAFRPTQTLYTVRQFAEAEPSYTEAALRNLIYKAEPHHSTKGEIPGNGLIECGALIRQGRKVLIHRERFLGWATDPKPSKIKPRRS